MDQILTRSCVVDSTRVQWMAFTYSATSAYIPRVPERRPLPQLKEEEPGEEQAEDDRLEGLTRIMVWVIGISTAHDNKRILRARFLRTLVVLWLIDPHHFGCASQASMARQFKFDKQSFNASVASFRRQFDYIDARFRSPLAVAHMRRHHPPLKKSILPHEGG